MGTIRCRDDTERLAAQFLGDLDALDRLDAVAFQLASKQRAEIIDFLENAK